MSKILINDKNFKKEFDFFNTHKDYVYLDSASTSLKPKLVTNAILNYYKNYGTNLYKKDNLISYELKQKINNCRSKIAKFINAYYSKEIIFTSGATHGLNHLSIGLKPLINEKDEILITPLEHSSNFAPWIRCAKETKSNLKFLSLDNNGAIDIKKLSQLVNSKTKIVSFSNVNNSNGYCQNVQKIVTQIRTINKNTIIIIDATQAIVHKLTDVQSWDIDFLVFGGHKMFGPTGIGVLWGKIHLLKQLQPLFIGGRSVRNISLDKHNKFIYQLEQLPKKLEAGSQNLAGIFGLNAALDFLKNVGIEQVTNHCCKLTKYFKTLYETTNLKNKIIWLNQIEDSNGLILFKFKGIPSSDVVAHLAYNKIIVRAGNFCSSNMQNVYNVNSLVRISISIYNTKIDIKKLIDILLKEKYFLGSM